MLHSSVLYAVGYSFCTIPTTHALHKNQASKKRSISIHDKAPAIEKETKKDKYLVYACNTELKEKTG